MPPALFHLEAQAAGQAPVVQVEPGSHGGGGESQAEEPGIQQQEMHTAQGLGRWLGPSVDVKTVRQDKNLITNPRTQVSVEEQPQA